MQTYRRFQSIIRSPRNQAQADKIRISNRRMEYLDRNPAYFESPEHEFAGKCFFQLGNFPPGL